MIAVTTFAGKKVAVFGLAGSGLATAHALTAGGAEVLCWDDTRERVQAADAAGLPTGDLRVADFAAFDTLVLSPGVPLTHPAPHWTVERATAAGIEIIGDIELFDRERRARLPGTKLIVVTGTNGKSTTTALLGHLLAEMGADAQIGGNIGRPALDLDGRDGVVVLEVSSFQADLSPTVEADVGVLINISPDHIDRHGTFENYFGIKKRLVERAAAQVIGLDSEGTRDYIREGAGTRVYASTALDVRSAEAVARTGPFRPRDVYSFDAPGLTDAITVDARMERQRFETLPHVREVPAGWDLWRGIRDAALLGPMPEVSSLRGKHNRSNVATALAAIMALGLDPADAVPHLATFPGLPHRMEEVGRDGDVVFINDSKATNADSTRYALASFERIHWIAGGKAKEGGVQSLLEFAPRISAAYLIGDAADLFERQLRHRMPTVRCHTLDVALDVAARAAKADGGTVLLSPACASYDQFRSFEHRGDVFRDLVKSRLSKETA